MKTKQAEKTISASSDKTSLILEQPLHANKQLVDVDNLTVELSGEKAVKDVSFCLHTGEFVGLIGPNGAGKTTLLKAILGLIKPTSGKVTLKKQSISYIPQHGLQNDQQIPMSVAEVVGLGGKNSIQALAEVNMQEFSKRPFTQLSGGQQQRVLIAKALAGEPSLLILDEPTTGIDENSQAHFYKLLERLNQKGIGIVMVSHDIDAVLRQVSRVICLNRTILYDGPAEHFETERYMPKLYAEKHKLLHHKHGARHA
jgi:zinc transport system ATP-binding protein